MIELTIAISLDLARLPIFQLFSLRDL